MSYLFRYLKICRFYAAVVQNWLNLPFVEVREPNRFYEALINSFFQLLKCVIHDTHAAKGAQKVLVEPAPNIDPVASVLLLGPLNMKEEVKWRWPHNVTQQRDKKLTVSVHVC